MKTTIEQAREKYEQDWKMFACAALSGLSGNENLKPFEIVSLCEEFAGRMLDKLTDMQRDIKSGVFDAELE